MFDSSFALFAAGVRLLDEKTLESMRLFRWHPSVTITLLVFVISVALGYLLAKWMRLKDHGWRFALIIAAWTVSISIIVLGLFKLGADLSGGVNLVYQVDAQETKRLDPTGMRSKDLNAVVSVLRQRLNPSGVKDLVIRKSGPQQIEVIVAEVDRSQIEEIKKLITTGGALRFLIVANDRTKDGHIIEAANEQSAERDRTQSTSEPPPSVKDADGKEIGLWMGLARVPTDVQGKDPLTMPFRHGSVLSDVIRDSRTGVIIDLTPAEQSEVASAGRDAIGQVLSDVLAAKGIRNIDVLLRAPDSEDLDVRGEDLSHSSYSLDADGWQINFTMKGQGIGKMAALTGQNIERGLAIVLDNELISSADIKNQISEQGQITGRFTQQEVNFMSELLNSGSMPVVLQKEPIAENQIGSTLGRDTIDKGSKAVVWSLAVVLVVVGLYYRFAGIVACLALVLNLLLTIAIMIIIQAPFTLPGLAGLVLTVGMSIDANVLIYERIREETARGAAFRMALRNGFDRAMATIIDSNLTTLLTAIVLYVIGTDQLKGFGVTVSLGIITSMFTAIFCARTIFEAGERSRWLTRLSMTQFLTNPTIDWVRLFVPATIASVILIVIGLGATVARGIGIFDIDLKGGTTVTAMLKEPMSDEEVREALARQFADVIDPVTKGKVDLQVYEIAIEGEKPQSVYKIDSSLEKVAELEKHVHDALRDPKTGEDRLRTYQMQYKVVASGDAGAAEVPEAAAPPASTDTGSDTESKEGENSRATEGAGCGQAEEQPAKEAAKADPEESDAEQAKDDKKSKEPAAEDTPAAADEAALPPSTAPGAVAPAETSPADARGADDAKTTFELTFPGNRISAAALKKHVQDAAKRLNMQDPQVDVTNDQWDLKSNTGYETWTVAVSLPEPAARRIMDDLQKVMGQSPVWQNTSSVSGQVTRDMQFRALRAILVSLLGIAAYVWFRFQRLSWGIAAVVSLAHDTLVMLTFISLSYWLAPALGILGVDEFKISLTVVAGFLTLIGYSINDTIVIFDRIREIRGKSTHIDGTMINVAVNQTLSRTILTGGLTLLTVIILYIFGGEGIHAFAFSMLIGVISGTYSTVFIAAPLLLWLLGAKTPASQPAKAAPVKQPVTTGRRA